MIIDPRNVCTIGGDYFLTDFILLPKWDAESLRFRPTPYQRVLPINDKPMPHYCITKKLTKDTPLIHYHPAMPIILRESECSKWLSWCDVRIDSPCGTLGREESVTLMRIKSGTDMEKLKDGKIDLCMVIQAHFDPDSDMNLGNWLNLAPPKPICKQEKKDSATTGEDGDGASPNTENDDVKEIELEKKVTDILVKVLEERNMVDIRKGRKNATCLIDVDVEETEEGADKNPRHYCSRPDGSGKTEFPVQRDPAQMSMARYHQDRTSTSGSSGYRTMDGRDRRFMGAGAASKTTTNQSTSSYEYDREYEEKMRGKTTVSKRRQRSPVNELSSPSRNNYEVERKYARKADCSETSRRYSYKSSQNQQDGNSSSQEENPPKKKKLADSGFSRFSNYRDD